MNQNLKVYHLFIISVAGVILWILYGNLAGQHGKPPVVTDGSVPTSYGTLIK